MNYSLLLIIFTTTFSYLQGNFISEYIDPLPIRNEIPKIIHQIWIGPKPLPEVYRRLTETVQNIHPDWEYKIWTNEDIEDFPWVNKEAFDKVKNYGMKSDIWRYEIINLYGGLYLDVDFECIRSFNPLIEKVTFATCYLPGEPVINKEHKYSFGCSMLAATPNHPLVEKLITTITKNTKTFNYDEEDWVQDFLFTGCFLFEVTFPPVDIVDKESGYCILPPEILHPFEVSNLWEFNFKIPKKILDMYLPNSFAIEHQGCSWSEHSKVKKL